MFIRLALKLPFLGNFLKQQQMKTEPVISPNANLNSRILKPIYPKKDSPEKKFTKIYAHKLALSFDCSRNKKKFT